MSQRLGVPSVSTGDLLRRLIASGVDTPLVRGAREIEKGAFVSDDFANRLALAELNKPAAAAGFILDGYPRSVPQAETLEAFLAGVGLGIEAVLVFSITPEELGMRLRGRRVCAVCGATYHVAAAPPMVEGRCDRCAGALVPRVEDNQPEKIALRQELYESQTTPLISFYEGRGLVKIISAEGTPGMVFARICEALEILV